LSSNMLSFQPPDLMSPVTVFCWVEGLIPFYGR